MRVSSLFPPSYLQVPPNHWHIEVHSHHSRILCSFVHRNCKQQSEELSPGGLQLSLEIFLIAQHHFSHIFQSSYIFVMVNTILSPSNLFLLSAHQIFFLGTQSKSFSRLTNNVKFSFSKFIFLQHLLYYENCINSSSRHEPYWHFSSFTTFLSCSSNCLSINFMPCSNCLTIWSFFSLNIGIKLLFFQLLGIFFLQVNHQPPLPTFFTHFQQFSCYATWSSSLSGLLWDSVLPNLLFQTLFFTSIQFFICSIYSIICSFNSFFYFFHLIFWTFLYFHLYHECIAFQHSIVFVVFLAFDLPFQTNFLKLLFVLFQLISKIFIFHFAAAIALVTSFLWVHLSPFFAGNPTHLFAVTPFQNNLD